MKIDQNSLVAMSRTRRLIVISNAVLRACTAVYKDEEFYFILFKHWRQRAEATYMPVKYNEHVHDKQ